MVKAFFDFVVSFALLVLLFPLFLLIAILIRLDSPGPVFYRGVRSGYRGKTFGMFKFRTMTVDPLRREGTTGLNDPRVTRVGRTLRRFKLDELPQLINVVRGEMSLVGPRPELPRYVEWYRGEERQILTVKPGITDLSSIQFSSLDEAVGATDVDRVFEEKILPKKNKLRVKYVQERSFGLDMKILALTAAMLVRKLWGALRARA